MAIRVPLRTIVSFILFSALSLPLAAQANSDLALQEFAARYGTIRKRGGQAAADRAAYFERRRFSPVRNRRWNPQLGPAPELPGAVTETQTLRVNRLKDFKGKYRVTKRSKYSLEVKFLEAIQYRIRRAVLPFKAGAEATFHKSGGLASFYGSYPRVIPVDVGRNKVHLSGWSSFTEEGEVRFVCPSAEDATFRVGRFSIPYHTSARDGYSQKIFFHSNGEVSSIHIRDPVTLSAYGSRIRFGHHQGCGADIDFYDDGSLKGGYLSGAQTIAGVRMPSESYVSFYPSGKLRLVLIREKKEIEVNGIKIGPAKTAPCYGGVKLFEDGKFQKIDGLRQAATFAGQRFRKGQTLSFRTDGKPPYEDEPGIYMD